MTKRKHRWELTWQHMHGTFLIADEYQCADCPAVRRSKVEGQDCPDCPPSPKASS